MRRHRHGEVLNEDALPDARLWAAVRALPEKQRSAIALRYVEDLSLTGIAAVLGCSEGTVKTHLFRARQTLATVLDAPREVEQR